MSGRYDELTVDFIILAAGAGKRMRAGQNKMFLPLQDIPILYRTMKRADENQLVSGIYVVLRREDHAVYADMIKRHGPISKLQGVIWGGAERADSVRNAMDYLKRNGQGNVIMVHDGARPFFTTEILSALVSAIEENTIVIPGLAVTDTLRQFDHNGRTKVIDRARLYQVQTPQAFLKSDMDTCYFGKGSAAFVFTDDASYFEQQGYNVKLIPGDKRNIKVTEPEDREWSEAMLGHYPALRLLVEIERETE